jgi:hypothetical protein
MVGVVVVVVVVVVIVGVGVGVVVVLVVVGVVVVVLVEFDPFWHFGVLTFFSLGEGSMRLSFFGLDIAGLLCILLPTWDKLGTALQIPWS